MTTDTKKQQTELDLILTKLNEAIKQVTTVQGNVHNVLIASSIYAYKYNDATIVDKIMSNLHGVRGSFRLESVAYWFKHIAGLNTSFSEKTSTWSTKFNKQNEYASEQGVVFTYDKVHVAILKEEKFRFWKVAPIQIKELKLATDLDKVTASAEIQLARSFAAGQIDQASIAAHVASMTARIVQLANSGKTKEWLNEFYTQHPEQKPVLEMDEIEKEIAQLEQEELEDLEVTI